MDFEPIDRMTEDDLVSLVDLYQTEWWSKGRRIEDVRRMLAGTDLVVVGLREKPGGRLAAFSRILTDGVYKAIVFDVIVAERHRGTGLGRRLLDAILAHPRLASVQSLELYCLPDLVPYYEKWGFTDDVGGVRLMRRVRRS